MIQAVKNLYNKKGAFYATVWTVVQAAVAAAAGYKTDNAQVALVVLVLVTSLSKVARDQLAARKDK